MSLFLNSRIKNFARLGLIIFCSIASNSVVSAKMFTVTGYYSPLPNQEFYLTGDYESELRLNGKGLFGADGTEVYHGMIAAPRNYKFGTHICLEKLGCGTVHDRGGAIVKKGERSVAKHDRIDFWMGYGTEGLEKSLLWGVRHVNGQIVNKPKPQKVSVFTRRKELPGLLLEIVRHPEKKNIFTKNLYPGYRNSEVRRLQEALYFLNFFRGDFTGFYGPQTQKAVLNFQLVNDVIDNENSRGAGNFGPKTRTKMSKILREKLTEYFRRLWKTNVFRENLSYDDHDIDVFRLQQLLIDKGYLEATPTGYFGPKTKEALKEFQLAEGIIKSKNSRGAGNFGPQTRARMKQIWLAKRDSFFPQRDNGYLLAAGGTLDTQISVEKKQSIIQFTSEEKLFRGKRNSEVRKLQKVLKKLGFFAGKETGFFGDKTAEALLAFQIKHNIVSSRRSIGASIFGPSTRAKMNEILRKL